MYDTEITAAVCSLTRAGEQMGRPVRITQTMLAKMFKVPLRVIRARLQQEVLAEQCLYERLYNENPDVEGMFAESPRIPIR